MERIDFSFEPFIHRDSEILILGSFPSPKSREVNFFYGHPQNRFWKVLPIIFGEEPLIEISEKKDFLKRNKIALTDAALSVSIEGASDASMRDIIPNDIPKILEETNIKRVYCNGKKSHDITTKMGVDAIYLPSTSPANARYSLERLIEIWREEILEKNL